MEGMFQLLIIVVFIVASIIDAVARNRKRQEQKDRLDREEEGEGVFTADGATGAARPGAPEGRRKAPMPGGRRSREETGSAARREPGAGASKGRPGRPSPAGAGSRSESRRTAADEMIPEDFWAILTGQAPKRQAPAEDAGEDPPVVPHIPAPVPSDRYEDPDSTAEADRDYARSPASLPRAEGATAPDPAAPTRRSARWMEGLGKEPRAASGRAAEPRPSTFPRAFDPMAEPWGQFEDISKGEIGDGRGRTQGEADTEAGPRRRAGATDSPYVRLVAGGTTEDLRSAVVLREVLGTPVAARDRGDAIGGWRWED